MANGVLARPYLSLTTVSCIANNPPWDKARPLSIAAVGLDLRG
jgi:hypothetical protein